MMYTLERQVTTLGKGITIRHVASSYEQIGCQDGFTARIIGNNASDLFTGILYHPQFADREQDYQLYKDITDRLTRLAGTGIPHSKADFTRFITKDGLEAKLKTGITVRINPHHGKLPDAMYADQNKRAHRISTVMGVLYFGSGICLAIYGANAPNLYEEVGLFACFVGAMELILRKNLGYGFLSTPYYFSSRMLVDEKVRNRTSFLDDFTRAYEQLKKADHRNQKKSERLRKKLDMTYSLLREQFFYTVQQKGFSIHYQSPSKEKITALFTYVLQDGTVPQLAGIEKAERKPAPPPIQAGFTDPWEIEEPRIGPEEGNR
ncbi:MAG: hypothetical protein V1743_04225 [Nanoarchaeota archaeon]